MKTNDSSRGEGGRRSAAGGFNYSVPSNKNSVI